MTRADLQEIAEYIDWQPFFIAWEMHGKFPQLLSDEVIGEAATRLYDDAKTLLKKIIDEKWLTPRGVIGIWPANATADDTVTIYTNSRKNSRIQHADLNPESIDLNFFASNPKKPQVNPIFLWLILLHRLNQERQIISVLFQ